MQMFKCYIMMKKKNIDRKIMKRILFLLVHLQNLLIKKLEMLRNLLSENII